MTSFLNPSTGFPCITAHYQRSNGPTVVSHCTATKGSLIILALFLVVFTLSSCTSSPLHRLPLHHCPYLMVASYFLFLTA